MPLLILLLTLVRLPSLDPSRVERFEGSLDMLMLSSLMATGASLSLLLWGMGLFDLEGSSSVNSNWTVFGGLVAVILVDWLADY